MNIEDRGGRPIVGRASEPKNTPAAAEAEAEQLLADAGKVPTRPFAATEPPAPKEQGGPLRERKRDPQWDEVMEPLNSRAEVDARATGDPIGPGQPGMETTTAWPG